jgi:hypothetical protein
MHMVRPIESLTESHSPKPLILLKPICVSAPKPSVIRFESILAEVPTRQWLSKSPSCLSPNFRADDPPTSTGSRTLKCVLISGEPIRPGLSTEVGAGTRAC